MVLHRVCSKTKAENSCPAMAYLCQFKHKYTKYRFCQDRVNYNPVMTVHRPLIWNVNTVLFILHNLSKKVW